MESAAGVTRTLARFVVASKPDDVPAAAVHEAKRSLLHWIGCSIGGSMCKSLHIGRAAQNGLFAALLANRNYSSSNAPIEAPRGFAHVLGENPDLVAITANLGRTFEVMQNTYKPFPCGIVVHPIVDGCITLASAHDIVVENVARVVLRVNPLVLELTGRKTPVTTAEAKLSVYHSAAAAIVARRITEREYDEDVVTDPDVLSLRTRIDAIADAGIREDEADIVVELRDGRLLHHHVEHAIGSAQRPMSASI